MRDQWNNFDNPIKEGTSKVGRWDQEEAAREAEQGQGKWEEAIKKIIHFEPLWLQLGELVYSLLVDSGVGDCA